MFNVDLKCLVSRKSKARKGRCRLIESRHDQILYMFFSGGEVEEVPVIWALLKDRVSLVLTILNDGQESVVY